MGFNSGFKGLIRL